MFETRQHLHILGLFGLLAVNLVTEEATPLFGHGLGLAQAKRQEFDFAVHLRHHHHPHVPGEVCATEADDG